ncbi:MAG: GNAT family N-acetyltransferase [Pseudomonadota bacterium]
MHLTLLDISKDFSRIETIWREMSSGSDVSYFMSWGWVENWLTTLPNDVRPHLALVRENDRPLMAFFLGKADLVRHHVFKSHGLFVNAIGTRTYDNIWIEYNHFLNPTNMKIPFGDVLALLPEPWDELFLPGLDMEGYPGNALDEQDFPYPVIIEIDSLSPYVDLELVRAKKGNYLSLLSSNTRSQIKRSYRLYESMGPVFLDVAESIEDGLKIFDEMVGLHLKVWQERGGHTSLASEYPSKFHKGLIRKRFEKGEIQLLRVRSGTTTIGCLYNFVSNGKVYFYQSGMNYEEDKRLKPGYITHVEAVQYNAKAGHSVYDFLAGSERYKMSLATDKKRLIWVKIQKPLLKFSIENRLKAFKRSVLKTFMRTGINS